MELSDLNDQIVKAVEKLSGVPVTAVFVGPGREQTLLREPRGNGGGGDGTAVARGKG